jgi:hypothetical protein
MHVFIEMSVPICFYVIPCSRKKAGKLGILFFVDVLEF